MRRVFGLAVATAALALSGCGGTADTPDGKTDTPEASTECVESMRVAAEETDPAKAVPLIEATLDACTTEDEWVAALREYPAAMGLSPQDTIGNDSLAVACGPYMDKPVCQDFLKKLQESKKATDSPSA